MLRRISASGRGDAGWRYRLSVACESNLAHFQYTRSPQRSNNLYFAPIRKARSYPAEEVETEFFFASASSLSLRSSIALMRLSTSCDRRCGSCSTAINLQRSRHSWSFVVFVMPYQRQANCQICRKQLPSGRGSQSAHSARLTQPP